MSIRTVAISLTVFAVLGCRDSSILDLPSESKTPDGIGFEVKEALFTTGDTVYLVLTNSSNQNIGYNLCMSTLEQWDGKDWHRVQKVPEYFACILPLYGLAPGEFTEYPNPVYDFIEAGAYRFKDEIEWRDSGKRVEVVSNWFHVEG